MRTRVTSSSLIGTVIVMAAIAICTSVAHADANTAKAKQLYDEGVTNYNLGHYDEALTAFDMAYRVRHDAAFLFNIAQCQRQLHRYEDAERSYRAYLRESPSLPPTTREQVQKLVAEMENAIEEQRAKQPPTGTQAPGTTQPGEIQTSPTSAPQTAAQPAAPPQAITPAVAPTTSSAEHNRTLRKVGIGLLIAGVAVAGVGGGLAGYSSSLYSQAKNATVLGDQRDLTNRSDVVNDAAWPLIGVGCAAVVGGAVTLAISFRRTHSETRAMVQR